MTGDIILKDLKMPQILPSGTSRSKDVFYNISMLIILAIIVYALYQIYKGYQGIKKLPEDIAKTISNIPDAIDRVSTGLLEESLRPYESKSSVEKRLSLLTPLESGLVKAGTILTLGGSPTLGAEARNLSLTEKTKQLIKPQLVNTEGGGQMLITRTATFDTLNPLTKTLVGIGNLFTGGLATQEGEKLKSYFQW